MSYSYTPGQGVTALVTTEPSGLEPYSNVAPAIRQIKSYLNDTSEGPAARIVTLVNKIVALEAAVAARAVFPIGTVAYAFREDNLEESGWMVADGRALVRADYPLLSAAIGTTYGSSSSLNFAIPTVAGRVIAGADAGAGVMPRDPETGFAFSGSSSLVGDRYGSEQVTLKVNHLPKHDVQVGAPLPATTFDGNVTLVVSGGVKSAIFGSGGNVGIDKMNPAGGGQPHNNMQKTIFLTPYIKFK